MSSVVAGGSLSVCGPKKKIGLYFVLHLCGFARQPDKLAYFY